MSKGSWWIVWAGVSAFAGTAVGHPVKTTFAAGTNLSYTWGELPVSTMVVDHCSASDETVTVNETLDPVANDTLLLPPGTICGIQLNLFDRVKLHGTGPSSSTFSLSLGVGQIDIPLDPPIYVDEEGKSDAEWVRLAAANWITATLLDMDPNEHVTVGALHALHDQLRDAIREDSAAW
jgi:hypothetical protein